MAGRDQRIKAFTIARDVFGRDETFDPQKDAIVRVEAARLRQRLSEYYNTRPADSGVRIDIPKGGYRAVFSTTTRQTEVNTPAPIRAPVSRLGYLVAGAALATLLLIIWWQIKPGSAGSVPAAGDQLGAGAKIATQGKPTLMIEPFEAVSAAAGDRQVARRLGQSVAAKLATQAGITVIQCPSRHCGQESAQTGNLSVGGGYLGASYLVRGALTQDTEAVSLKVQLLNPITEVPLWSDYFSHSIDSALPLEEDLALRVATRLTLYMQPEERLPHRAVQKTDSEVWVLYEQAWVMLIPPNDATRIVTARKLFRHAYELDPLFAGGYAGESFTYSIASLFVQAAVSPHAIAEAIALANKAIDLNRDFGMGYAALSFAQILDGNIEVALANARRAVLIQTDEAFLQFILGMNLIIAGQADEAILFLKEALRLDPLESRTPYLNVLGIAYYAAGQYPEALEMLDYNIQRAGPRGPHMDVFLAASYAQSGQEKQARSILDRITLASPEFPFEQWLANWLSRNEQAGASWALLQQLQQN